MDPGWIIYLLGKFQVSLSLEKLQAVVGFSRRQSVLWNEIKKIEVKYIVFTWSLGYLKIIAESLINIFYLFRRRKFFPYWVVQPALIRRRVQEDGICRFIVAPRPAALLEIVFNGIRHIPVHDKPYLCFINTHSESIRSNNNPGIPCRPCCLFFIPYFIGQAGMIVVSAYSSINKHLSHFPASLPASYINNAASLRILQSFNQICSFILYFPYQVIDILSPATCSQHIMLPECKLVHNILYNQRSCCCSKCQKRDISLYMFP